MMGTLSSQSLSTSQTGGNTHGHPGKLLLSQESQPRQATCGLAQPTTFPWRPRPRRVGRTARIDRRRVGRHLVDPPRRTGGRHAPAGAHHVVVVVDAERHVVMTLRQRGDDAAVLRLSEAQAAAIGSDATTPDDDERVLLNMGPSHPSTHGVLRLMLEMEGETVIRSKPVVGYLHTGMEKQAEQLTFLQGCTNVTRMDYASPFFTELAFSLATEKLLDIEVPERAVWIRMLMSELNRISSHLLFMATNGMDL